MKQTAKLKLKVEYEKRIVRDMITLYCRAHHSAQGLCDECRELADYADRRTDLCPFMEQKSFCSQCRTHCYRSDMRERIRQVMRYAGPRMIFHHPVAALRHLYYAKIKDKLKL